MNTEEKFKLRGGKEERGVSGEGGGAGKYIEAISEAAACILWAIMVEKAVPLHSHKIKFRCVAFFFEGKK